MDHFPSIPYFERNISGGNRRKPHHTKSAAFFVFEFFSPHPKKF
jgi:hypothetical protein